MWPNCSHQRKSVRQVVVPCPIRDMAAAAALPHQRLTRTRPWQHPVDSTMPFDARLHGTCDGRLKTLAFVRRFTRSSIPMTLHSIKSRNPTQTLTFGPCFISRMLDIRSHRDEWNSEGSARMHRKRAVVRGSPSRARPRMRRKSGRRSVKGMRIASSGSWRVLA